MEGRWREERHLHAQGLCQGEPKGAVRGPRASFEPRDTETGSCRQLQPRRLLPASGRMPSPGWSHPYRTPSPGWSRPSSSHLLSELEVRETPPHHPLLGATSNLLAPGPAPQRASRSREGKEPSQGPSAAPGRGWLGARVGTEAAGSAPVCGCQRQIHSPRFGSSRQSAPAGGREFPGPGPAPRRLSPRWEAGDVPSQSSEGCRHSPSPTAAGSLLPSAGPMPGGLRGPGGSGREETESPAPGTGSLRPPRSGSSPLGSASQDPSSQHIPAGARAAPGASPERPCLGRRAGPGRSQRCPSGSWHSPRGSGAGSGRCHGDGEREVEVLGRGGSATGWSCPGRL